jgi:hypothetical protein
MAEALWVSSQIRILALSSGTKQALYAWEPEGRRGSNLSECAYHRSHYLPCYGCAMKGWSASAEELRSLSLPHEPCERDF